ncbi:MAG: cell division protein FtsA [Verrucomicrobiia bacterium]
MKLFDSILKPFRRGEDFMVGLDIGTSNIKIAVGQTRPDGSLAMVGSHMAESQGICKGEIQNQERASEAIVRALKEAEDNLNIGMELVELAVTGAHITSGTHTGHATVQGESMEVTDEDAQAAVDSASSCAQLGSDRAMIHTVRCSFELDGSPPLGDPVGQICGNLKAEVHCIHGQKTRLKNLLHCLSVKLDTNVEVSNTVFSGLASALAVLDPEDKKLGAIVIDIGGGITEYAVYSRGALRQSGTLAVGGDHLVNDLMVGLGIRQRRKVEKLLHMAGGVMVEASDRGQEVAFSSTEILGERSQVYYIEDIHRILHERMNETFGIIQDRIRSRDMAEITGATVFLTGGCSRLKGMVQLAQSVFDRHAKQGVPGGFEGQIEHLRTPEMATAVGLVKYAHMRRLVAAEAGGGLGNFIKKAFAN